MSFLQSPQAFIRALKAPSDPPLDGGPAKVDIARQAWENDNLYFPSKAEVIVEWILSTFLKEKSQKTPIFNENYWRLLLRALSDKVTSGSRPIKAWLSPLLHRIPLQPILSAFLGQYRELDSPNELASVVSSCVSIMWPISVQKMSLENLADLFGAVLQEADEGDLTLGILEIGTLAASSYRSSLSNSANKKKSYQLFLQSFADRWLRVLTTRSTLPEAPEYKRFSEHIYDVGIESLFNLDMIRQLSEVRSTEQSTLLFDHLRLARSSQSSSALSAIPQLFSSYVQMVKRHRGAVFGQSSNARGSTVLNIEVNAAAMRFFGNCEAVLSQDGDAGAKGDVRVWNARLHLLQAVLDENLFSIQQEDATVVLNRIIEDVTGILANSWKDEQNDAISAAVMCLHKIGQIDCDLLPPVISRVLPSILPLPTTDSAPASLLDLILDYHTKTRTLNTHILNLLSSLAPSSLPSTQTADTHRVYQQCFSGHILSARYLEKVGNVIRRFLTPGQTPKAVESLLGVLKDSWEAFIGAAERKAVGAHDESPRKKKRKEGKEGKGEDENGMDVDSNTGTSTTGDAELFAVSFALQAYLSIIVLSNIPLKSLPEDSANDVRGALSAFRDDFIRRTLKKLLKPKRLLSGTRKRKRVSSTGKNGWGMQIVAPAVLRVHYALCTARSLDLSINPDMRVVVDQAKEIATKECGRGNLIAELELEIFRTLLYHISTQEAHETEAIQVFDSVLLYLNRTFKPTCRVWPSLSCLLNSEDKGALALLHLILERWLPFVDHLASPAQLTNIIQLILSIDLDATMSVIDSNSLRSDHLLLRLLHSAEFWEMHNFRTALLSHLIQATSGSESQLGESELVAYNLLLHVPTEYFTKTARTHFVRRAYTADMQLVRHFGGMQKEKQATSQQSVVVLRKLVNLRMFLGRVSGIVGFERVPEVDLGDFLVHLVSFDCQVEGPEYVVFIQSTLELIELCFRELLRTPTSNSGALLKVVSTFGQYPMLTNTPKYSVRSLHSNAIMKLLDMVTGINDTSSLPSDCIASLRNFYKQLSKTVHKKLQDLQPSQLNRNSETLAGWRSALKLRNWLKEDVEGESDGLGRYLVGLVGQELGNDEEQCDIKVSILAILREELLLLAGPRDREGQLDLIVAAYIIFCRTLHSSVRAQLDGCMSLISKSLSSEEYSHVLDLLSEPLSTLSTSPDKLQIVLHLSILLLREHPQHTLRHMQTFVTHCLNLFAGNRVFIDGPVPLRLLTLEFIVQHCSEGPAALRSVDLGSIWVVLFKFLEPSEEHDESTTPEIFHKIVACISALIRLRRDLLTPVLPHLGLILRRLLSSIRSCRPQLGTKQTVMVMRTQPRWISARMPLGWEEGRALSRLLETLNTKTIIRSHTASEIQKAESLAKPFSKHAAYVLAAYIEALNDPLCVLSVEMRRQLEPGLFSLCGLMGEYARDAMVVWLDANGKAALKLIWKEYEKQRYVGKG